MAVIQTNDSDFTHLLETHPKVVVKYHASWCGSCRLFAPKYGRLSDDERFQDVAFLDVDAEASPEARKLAGVSNLPFFAVFKHGELQESVATSKEENVVALLGKLA